MQTFAEARSAGSPTVDSRLEIHDLAKIIRDGPQSRDIDAMQRSWRNKFKALLDKYFAALSTTAFYFDVRKVGAQELDTSWLPPKGTVKKTTKDGIEHYAIKPTQVELNDRQSHIKPDKNAPRLAAKIEQDRHSHTKFDNQSYRTDKSSDTIEIERNTYSHITSNTHAYWNNDSTGVAQLERDAHHAMKSGFQDCGTNNIGVAVFSPAPTKEAPVPLTKQPSTRTPNQLSSEYESLTISGPKMEQITAIPISFSSRDPSYYQSVHTHTQSREHMRLPGTSDHSTGSTSSVGQRVLSCQVDQSIPSSPRTTSNLELVDGVNLSYPAPSQTIVPHEDLIHNAYSIEHAESAKVLATSVKGDSNSIEKEANATTHTPAKLDKRNRLNRPRTTESEKSNRAASSASCRPHSRSAQEHPVHRDLLQDKYISVLGEVATLRSELDHILDETSAMMSQLRYREFSRTVHQKRAHGLGFIS